MSKGLVETITELFKPQAPLWACELTSRHIVVAGVNAGRNKITEKLTAEFPVIGGRATPASPEKKAADGVEAAGPIIRQLLSQAGFKGSEIAVVVPDGATRIALLPAENPSKNPEEQRTFIRWKLKKSIPFDVDTAQVAYRILGPRRNGPGVDILAAISPQTAVREYEALFDGLEIHAGMVLPSTLATLNLLSLPETDTLFVKIAPDCITTTVFQNRRVQFYRRVTDLPLYDAVYPTVLYYQDKLGGKAFERFYVCGDHPELNHWLQEIHDKLSLAAVPLEPRNVEDIYKPALGAIHLKPQAVD